MSGQWEGSTRRAGLPDDWPAIKAQVWTRDNGQCQWPMDLDTYLVHPLEAFTREGVERCGAPGEDVDHIEHGSTHELHRLQLLCGWHHDRKSSAEGNTARKAKNTKAKPRHPGLLE